MSLLQSIEGGIEHGSVTGASFYFKIPILEWEPPGISIDVVKAANLLPVSPRTQITPPQQQWDDPALDTRVQLYQDDGFYQDLEHGATDGQVYEIARFQANAGECGFVKYIGTYVQILDPDSGDPVELDFSNPFAMQDAGVKANFLLRLSPGDENTLGTAPWTGPVATVPGYGYPELPYWNDYRFYWGRYANHVWFLVPRRHFLRLFIHIETGGSELNRALGRLQGYTQPISTIGAQKNATYGW